MIYFLRYGTKRLVKIGYSKDHPEQRILTLQTGCPVELELIGMAEGTPKDEANWHRRFKHLRVRGEWFRWTGELSKAAKPHLRTTYEKKLRKVRAENAALEVLIEQRRRDKACMERATA